MLKNKPKNKIWGKMKIIQKQYPEILDVMTSPITAEIIKKIAIDYGLQESDEIEKHLNQEQELDNLASSKIAGIVGQVLLGNLIPIKLSLALKEELNIEIKMAKDISKEINQKLFSDIKIDIYKLYKIKKRPLPFAKKPPSQKRPDVYRESTK